MTKSPSSKNCVKAYASGRESISSCRCAATGRFSKSRMAKYVTGFVGLCFLCCAIPATLIAIGVLGTAAGAYMQASLEAALGVLTASVLAYFLIRYLKKKQEGARK